MKVRPLLKIFALAFFSAVLAGVAIVYSMRAYNYFTWSDSHSLAAARVQIDVEELRAEIVKRNRGLSNEEIQMKMDERLANADALVMETLRKRILGAGISRFDLKMKKEGDFVQVKIRNDAFSSISARDALDFAIEYNGPGYWPFPVPVQNASRKNNNTNMRSNVGDINVVFVEPFEPNPIFLVPIVFFAVFFILLRKHLKNKATLPTHQGIIL